MFGSEELIFIFPYDADHFLPILSSDRYDHNTSDFKLLQQRFRNIPCTSRDQYPVKGTVGCLSLIAIAIKKNEVYSQVHQGWTAP